MSGLDVIDLTAADMAEPSAPPTVDLTDEATEDEELEVSDPLVELAALVLKNELTTPRSCSLMRKTGCATGSSKPAWWACNTTWEESTSARWGTLCFYFFPSFTRLGMRCTDHLNNLTVPCTKDVLHWAQVVQVSNIVCSLSLHMHSSP